MNQHELVENSSRNRGYEAEQHTHVIGIPVYLSVFAILMVGTVATVLVANLDLDEMIGIGGVNTLVALVIALFKTSFVVLFFMHVRYSGKLIWLAVIGGFFWLLIMFTFTMSDYLTRGNGQFR